MVIRVVIEFHDGWKEFWCPMFLERQLHECGRCSHNYNHGCTYPIGEREEQLVASLKLDYRLQRDVERAVSREILSLFSI